MSIKAYKGFNKDMTCRGFQFKEGETYHEDTAKMCESGFHACLDPLDCFRYYSPHKSVYHEVELDDVTTEKSKDSKICGKTLKVGAALDIAGIVKTELDVIYKKIKKERSSQGYRSANSSQGNCSANSSQGAYSANSSQGYYSANSSQGNCSANSSQGAYSANSSQGYYSANSSQGACSANSSQGNYSANSSQGYCSANSSQGACSANSSQGNYSANSSQGYCSANSSQGAYSANVSLGAYSSNEAMGKSSICVGWGRENKCKATKGSYIVLSEYGEWNGNEYPLICAKMHKVDGKTIKPDTWYMLKGGKFVEITNDEVGD